MERLGRILGKAKVHCTSTTVVLYRYQCCEISVNATLADTISIKRKVLEAFSPGVEKRLCRFFESKNFGVCNAFLHTKLADQLETWHSKTLFRLRG